MSIAWLVEQCVIDGEPKHHPSRTIRDGSRIERWNPDGYPMQLRGRPPWSDTDRRAHAAADPESGPIGGVTAGSFPALGSLVRGRSGPSRKFRYGSGVIVMKGWGLRDTSCT